MRTQTHTQPWPLVLLLVLGAFLLPACAEAESPDGLAIVYSARSNQPQYDFAGSKHLQSLIGSAIGTRIPIISSDGEPSVLSAVDTDVSYARNISDRSLAKAQRTSEVMTTLAASAAKKPESDILSAIAIAADSLNGSGGTRTVAVCDSGLTTVAPLALQQTSLLVEGADIEAAVEELASHRALPDLSGVKVSWMCLGGTTAPQPALDLAAKGRLKALWESILARSGASVEFVGDPLDPVESPIRNTPKVTPVPVDAFALEGAAAPVSITLPETVLPFRPDTAAFLDPDGARAVIGETASRLLESGAPRASVTGCTATWGESEYRDRLSHQRADTVAELLRASGVEVVSTRGLGSECPGKINDLDESGGLIESLAASNRRVIISAQ